MRIKTLWLLFLLLLIMISLTACQKKYEYDSEWIIGKNSNEVIEKYGMFDVTASPQNDEGLYYCGTCSYIIVPKKVGYLGTTPEKLFSISFDESGTAYRCFEETGGKGG